MLNVTCPCGFAGKIPESMVGKTIRCKQCGTQFTTLPPDDEPLSYRQPPPIQPVFEEVAEEPRYEPFRPYDPEASFTCPFCKARGAPIVAQKVSTGGWICFALFFLVCFPLFWIGLMLKEDVRSCSSCGIRLG